MLYWYNSANTDADESRGAAVYASISAAIDALMTVCLKAALSQLAEERQVLRLLTYADVC